MRYLTLGEVLALHHRIVQKTGGSLGLRDLGGLQSALAQPRTTFAGTELYTDIVEKVAALGYSLVLNHPFLDGNKRTGHAAMEAFLLLNGHELVAEADEQKAFSWHSQPETSSAVNLSKGSAAISENVPRQPAPPDNSIEPTPGSTPGTLGRPAAKTRVAILSKRWPGGSFRGR